MSRAVNVAASIADVRASARDQAAVITAIESLASGGTRVVFQTASDADRMRHVFARALLTGAVARTPWASQG